MKGREWGPSSQRGDLFGVMDTGDAGSAIQSTPGMGLAPMGAVLWGSLGFVC